MPIYRTDSDDEPWSYSTGRTSHAGGHHRPLHTLFGGGKVANVLLWRNKSLSAAILLGATLIWFLFEVVEYHFITFVCHLFITILLILFIWSNAAPLVNRNPPQIPAIILSQTAFREVALAFHKKMNRFVTNLFILASGKDLPFLLLLIAGLWILSVIGTYFSGISLLYIGFLCIGTLPALYERYQVEVDMVARKGNRNLRKLYRRFDSKVLNKIPRGPVKQKKSK